MPHSIVYKGTPIEKLGRKELMEAIEDCCCTIELWKESAEWWKKRVEAQKKDG